MDAQSKHKKAHAAIITSLWAASTLFFLYQHTTGLSWDFSAYVLNAKYLLDQGSYFEWTRPPLSSLILGLLSVLGWKAAEYAYIIAVSTFFTCSAVRLAKSCDLDPAVFYGLLLSPFLLNLGMKVGTELLSLSLLLLFLADIEKRRSSVWLGLALLTKYTMFSFLPLLLFKKRPKEIILSCLIAAAVYSPWLAYNYLATGDALTSPADAYAMNMKFRYEYMNLYDARFSIPLLISLWLLLPAFIGAWIRLGKRKPDRMDLLMLSLGGLCLFTFLRIPLKDERYLFPLLIPAAYFASRLFAEKASRGFLIGVVCFSYALGALFFMPLTDTAKYAQIIPYLDGCMLQSNEWIYFNYFGIPTEPAPVKNEVEKQIDEGKRILLYRSEAEPDYTRDPGFIKSLPEIRETEEYILLGNVSKCAEKTNVDKTYLQRLRDRGVETGTAGAFMP